MMTEVLIAIPNFPNKWIQLLIDWNAENIMLDRTVDIQEQGESRSQYVILSYLGCWGLMGTSGVNSNVYIGSDRPGVRESVMW